MRLGLDSFRAIKPVGSVDDYIAGQAEIDEKGLTRKQLSELFTARIIGILTDNSGVCTKQITSLSGVSQAATAKKLRTLKSKGIVKCFSERVGSNTKPTNFYSLVEIAQ